MENVTLTQELANTSREALYSWTHDHEEMINTLRASMGYENSCEEFKIYAEKVLADEPTNTHPGWFHDISGTAKVIGEKIFHRGHQPSKEDTTMKTKTICPIIGEFHMGRIHPDNPKIREHIAYTRLQDSRMYKIKHETFDRGFAVCPACGEVVDRRGKHLTHDGFNQHWNCGGYREIPESKLIKIIEEEIDIGHQLSEDCILIAPHRSDARIGLVSDTNCCSNDVDDIEISEDYSYCTISCYNGDNLTLISAHAAEKDKTYDVYNFVRLFFECEDDYYSSCIPSLTCVAINVNKTEIKKILETRK